MGSGPQVGSHTAIHALDFCFWHRFKHSLMFQSELIQTHPDPLEKTGPSSHIPWGKGWGEFTRSFRSYANASSHESYLFFPVTWGGLWGARGQGGTSGKGCWVNAPRKAWVKCLRKAWGVNRFYPNHTMDSSSSGEDNTVKWNSAPALVPLLVTLTSSQGTAAQTTPLGQMQGLELLEKPLYS